MIFKDLAIGARFMYEEKQYIKLSCIDVYYLEKIFKFAEYLEVELISKCTNCKYWVDKRDEIGSMNYCYEVSISHNDKEVFPDMELTDQETFSCCKFIMKVNY